MAFKSVSKNVCISVLFLICTTQLIYAENEAKWFVRFKPVWGEVNLRVNTDFELTIHNVSSDILQSNAIIRLVSSDTKKLKVSKIIPLYAFENGTWHGIFTVTPVQLGKANIYVQIDYGNKIEISYRMMSIFIRRNRIDVDLDESIFSGFTYYFIHFFYILLNITLGAAFNLKKLKAIIRMPSGVGIAFLLNLCILPLVSG